MKTRSLYMTILAALLSGLISLTGCTLETSGNGDLDGNWHLLSIETIATGDTADLSDDLYFWAFQGKLLQLSDYANGAPVYLMRFNHDGETLTLTDPYLYNREEGDMAMEDVSTMAVFGISDATEIFTIEELSGSRMVLNNGALRLRFRKQ